MAHRFALWLESGVWRHSRYRDHIQLGLECARVLVTGCVSVVRKSPSSLFALSRDHFANVDIFET